MNKKTIDSIASYLVLCICIGVISWGAYNAGHFNGEIKQCNALNGHKLENGTCMDDVTFQRILSESEQKPSFGFPSKFEGLK